jgi:hypothetical protein
MLASFLQGFPKPGAHVQLLPSAFPALQRLELADMSLNHADLSNLSAFSCLSSLKLNICNTISTDPSSSSCFATMSSLRQLCIDGIDSNIVSGLTQLTSLTLGRSTPNTIAHSLANIIDLTQLQQLELPLACKAWGTAAQYPAGLVSRISTTFTQLRSLALNSTLSQGELDVLLAHGTHLTHLTVGGLNLSKDRSASPCSWKELVVQQPLYNISWLTCLPLHSLTRLCFDGWELPSPCPVLRVGRYCGETQRVLTTLATCPAWISSGPCVEVHVSGDGYAAFSQQYLAPLAAVRTIGRKQVSKLTLTCVQRSLSATQVEALGQEVGSTLTHLQLDVWPVLPNVWPAVCTHLPVLQALSIAGRQLANVSTQDLRNGMEVLCSSAARPLQLQLSDSLYIKFQQDEQLQDLFSSQNKPLVTVTRWSHQG